MSHDLVKLYYRIGEVADIVGVQPHVLRYWESEFRTIRPQKSSKGQRVYSKRDVERLLHVKDLLRNQGFTIAGAKRRLREENLGNGKILPGVAADGTESASEINAPALRLVPDRSLEGTQVTQPISSVGFTPPNLGPALNPGLRSLSASNAANAMAYSGSPAQASASTSLSSAGLTDVSSSVARSETNEARGPSHWILPSRSSGSANASSRFQAVSDAPDQGSDARTLRRGLLAVREELARWVGELESDSEN